MAGLLPRSMACWDMVVAAPEELDVWVRPISCAVTGDVGKVIWIWSSIMKNVKRKMQRLIFVLRGGQSDGSDNTDTY